MKLRSPLAMKQRENLDTDFEESHFFLFHKSYPVYHFAFLAELKRAKIPMLFYNDHNPDLELCKVDITENQGYWETI
jgi:hypothetical protein